MKKVELQNEKLESLALLFIKKTIVLNSKWKGKELPPLHRLFPCDIVFMFRLWYSWYKSPEGDVRIIFDEGCFIGHFERLLKEKNVKYNIVVSRNAYTLSQGKYKYQFSSLRLTKQGLEIYINLLPNKIKSD